MFEKKKLMTSVNLSLVPPFYHGYIQLIQEHVLNAAFRQHLQSLHDLLESIDEHKWGFRYAEGKWSIKELVQHVIDAERIFAYRALRFARKDKTALPGFDENEYATSSNADNRTKQELMEELNMVQKSSALLFASFDQEQLAASGIANGRSIYVEAIGFIIIGHALHHKKILEERYLSQL